MQCPGSSTLSSETGNCTAQHPVDQLVSVLWRAPLEKAARPYCNCLVVSCAPQVPSRYAAVQENECALRHTQRTKQQRRLLPPHESSDDGMQRLSCALDMKAKHVHSPGARMQAAAQLGPAQRPSCAQPPKPLFQNSHETCQNPRRALTQNPHRHLTRGCGASAG